MRDISIISGKYFKHSDSDTNVVIRLYDDNDQTIPSDIDSVKIKVRGDEKHTIDTFKPDSINDDGDLVISSEHFSDLDYNSYALEVWVTQDDKTLVYPSETNPEISIISNIDDGNNDDTDGTNVVVKLDTDTRQLTVGNQVITIPSNIDLSQYAKKSEVPSIAYDKTSHKLTLDGETVALQSDIDLSNYYTKHDIDQKLANLSTGGTIDLSSYAKVSDLQNLQNQVDQDKIKIDLVNRTITFKSDGGQDQSINIPNSVDLSDYAKKDDLPKVTLDLFNRTISVNDQTLTIPNSVDLSNYYNKSDIDSKLDELKELINQHGGSGDQPVSIIPTFTIGNINTVDSSNEASATLTKINDHTYSLNFNIPRGEKGLKGDKGDQGLTGSTYVPYINSDGHLHAKLDHASRDDETNLDDVLTKTEAESTYVKKSDIPDIKFDVDNYVLTINGHEIKLPKSLD